MVHISYYIETYVNKNLAAVYASVLRAMQDPEIPVKVQAALALRELITSHESGTSASSLFAGIGLLNCYLVKVVVGSQIEKVIQGK